MKKLLKVFGCLCVCAPALCCGGFSDPYDDIYMHIYRLFMLHKTSEAVELCLHTIEDENLPKTFPVSEKIGGGILLTGVVIETKTPDDLRG